VELCVKQPGKLEVRRWNNAMNNEKQSRMGGWMAKGFLLSVAVLLLSTATLKLLGLPTETREWLKPDPVVSFLKSRDMVVLAVLVEFMVGLYLILGRNHRLKLAVVLMLTLAFAWYRLGLYIFGHTTACRCLGTIAKSLAAETNMNYILYGMLFYMGGGSLWGLLCERRLLGGSNTNACG